MQRADVPDGGRLSDTITLTVKTVDTSPRSPRDVELTTVDHAGEQIELIIWETHEIEQEWVEGHTYEIKEARGQRWESVKLHSISGFRAREVGQPAATRLLVIGDTHVGYRHRTQSNKSSRAQAIDAREVFTNCLSRARNTAVDAVVHAGDIFDHHNTQSDREHVREEIHQTVAAGIPFYYVHGNHDTESGRQSLERGPGRHIPRDQPTVGDCSVNLIGVDYSAREFPDTDLLTSVKRCRYRNVVVMHETPYPVVTDDGSVVYDEASESMNLANTAKSAQYETAVVVTGHHHTAKQA